MQCLPEWRAHEVPGETVYKTCLSDVYLSVQDSYDRKSRAIPAAVWRCRDHMPEPPAFYNPRCEINYRRRERDEDSGLQWPSNSTLGMPSCSATRHTGVLGKSRSWLGWREDAAHTLGVFVPIDGVWTSSRVPGRPPPLFCFWAALMVWRFGG